MRRLKYKANHFALSSATVESGRKGAAAGVGDFRAGDGLRFLETMLMPPALSQRENLDCRRQDEKDSVLGRSRDGDTTERHITTDGVPARKRKCLDMKEVNEQ